MALSLVGISATKCGFALDGRGWGEGRRQKLFQLRGVILMIRYYVVGGEYKDTHFAEAIGGDEQWFGPFTDYEAAKKEWAKHAWQTVDDRSEEHTSELQSLMRISYAVFCLKKKKIIKCYIHIIIFNLALSYVRSFSSQHHPCQ